VGGWDKNASDVPRETLIKIIVDISIDSSIIYIYQELTWWSKNSMNHKIKNFFTFGVYDRLVKAECEVINLKSKLSDLDIQSTVEDIIRNDGIVDDEIRNNFSPSDYDLVTTDDYDFDSFVTDDDVVDESRVERIIQNYLEDYHDAAEMDTAIKEGIKEHQGELVESMVKKVCKDMLVDWCQRTIIAAHKKQEETDSSSDNS
jgi:hypothetical protein